MSKMVTKPIDGLHVLTDIQDAARDVLRDGTMAIEMGGLSEYKKAMLKYKDFKDSNF